MSHLYEQMAQHWWDALTSEEQTAWLDAAEADGRERSPLAAYTLMGDLRERRERDDGIEQVEIDGGR